MKLLIKSLCTLPKQTFWVTLTAIFVVALMCFSTEHFSSYENLYNVTRNSAFIGIIALGQTAVILTGGIDLSVGSIMGLAGVVTALSLEAGHSLAFAIGAGLLAALLCGLINGVLICYGRLSSFVVTLGMLSIARSLALVISGNRMVYEFGQAQDSFLAMGSQELFGFALPVIVLLVLAIVFAYGLHCTVWGRYIYAVGGNEESSRLNGVPVERVKLSAYALSSLSAGFSGILTVAWLGSASTSLGMGYELTVIAAAVIGGASLIGGHGGAFGAIVGALLVEIIRNGLLLMGVDPYWQGTFVGCFIIFAIVLEGLQRRREA